MIVGAPKLCQVGTARYVQAGQSIVVAVKRCQGGTTRHLQAGQLIVVAVKVCHIASDGDRLAGEGVVNLAVPSSWNLFETFDGHVAISFNGQFDFLSDDLGVGHGDDAFGGEGGGGEERAEEDEEPDA